MKVIQCDVCGIADNALFWAYRGHGHAHLLLRCPTCGDYTHRYPIRPRAKHSSLDLAPVRRQVEIVAAIFLVGLPVYLLAAPTGRQLISGFEIRDAEAAPAAELSYRPEAAKGSETAAPPSERDAVLSPSIGTTVITEERSDPAAMTTFVAPGDRREHFRSEIADTEDDEDVLVEIRYLRDRDRTEVTLADPPPIWRVRLALHGWRPAGSP